MKPLTIALDFDGVVHNFTSPFTDSHEIHDGPVPGAFDFIRDAIKAGNQVFIHTARANTASVVPAIYAWLAAHGLEERYAWRITISALKPGADIYIDDLGWRFEGTWPTLEQIREMKPWNRSER